MRRRAKDLVRTADVVNIELAEVLYLVWDTPVEGDPNRGPTYASWGYKTFAEYAEEELGLKRRKAEYLRNIGAKLNQDLAGLDKDMKDKLVGLGWTKVRLLTSVLNLKNVPDWVELAERASYPELAEAVKKYRDKKLAAKVKKEEESEKGAEDDTTEEAEDEEEELPETENLKWEHFMLYEPQHGTVTAALNRAKELSGSDKKGHNLEMICTDFLATNEFKKADDPEAKKRYIAKVEGLLGLKLIAIDPESESIVYGLKTLSKFAKSGGGEE
jgi:hypothetical protein